MTTMKWAVATGAALLLASGASWAAVKPCEELKAEIETKIQAAGVTSYTLEIVDKARGEGPEYGGRHLRQR